MTVAGRGNLDHFSDHATLWYCALIVVLLAPYWLCHVVDCCIHNCIARMVWK